MMTDKDTRDAAAPDSGGSGAAARDAAGKHPKPHEHFVSPGAESTRELRELARRRREAEEKLQQRLKEAKEKPADG